MASALLDSPIKKVSWSMLKAGAARETKWGSEVMDNSGAVDSVNTGLGKTWGLTVGLSGFFILMLSLVVPLGEAIGRSVIILLPVFWLARLVIAHRSGCMTRRFNFLNNAGIEPALVVWKARVVNRSSDRCSYWSNWIRESFMCLVLWFLLGSAALSPLASLFGVV